MAGADVGGPIRDVFILAVILHEAFAAIDVRVLARDCTQSRTPSSLKVLIKYSVVFCV